MLYRAYSDMLRLFAFRFVAVCCGVPHFFAACCSVLRCATLCCSVLQCVVMCVFQYAASDRSHLCCSVLVAHVFEYRYVYISAYMHTGCGEQRYHGVLPQHVFQSVCQCVCMCLFIRGGVCDLQRWDCLFTWHVCPIVCQCVTIVRVDICGYTCMNIYVYISIALYMFTYTCIYFYNMCDAQRCNGLFPRHIRQIVCQCVIIVWVYMCGCTCMYVCVYISMCA